MKILKKISVLFLLLVFLFSANVSFADNSEDVDLYIFWGNGCPHCAKEKKFLASIQEKYPELHIHDFEVYYSEENQDFFGEVVDALDAGNQVGVPLTIIGEEYFFGFDENIHESKITDKIEKCVDGGCYDIVAANFYVPGENANPDQEIEGSTEGETELGFVNADIEKLNIPFYGEVDPLSFSLPALTILMGLLDGFNPCAMWSLLFLISLLLGMKDRKRMWILGTAFIATSAFVYFLFMAAWLNFMVFMGHLQWIRTCVAVVALIGGLYSLREFFVDKNTGCKVTGGEKRQEFFAKLKKITQMNSFWMAIGGIMVLAIAVNLVDFLCSFGLPMFYTQVLALNNLSWWTYYGYIFLYLFFFMIDDMFVFFAAMITMKMTGITTKYTRASKLISGILMLAIGILLITNPEALSLAANK